MQITLLFLPAFLALPPTVAGAAGVGLGAERWGIPMGRSLGSKRWLGHCFDESVSKAGEGIAGVGFQCVRRQTLFALSQCATSLLFGYRCPALVLLAVIAAGEADRALIGQALAEIHGAANAPVSISQPLFIR